jgi:L-aspartate oxidase
MSLECGVVRTAEGLERLLALITDLEQQTGASLSLTAAHLIATAAFRRQESRGGHFRADHTSSGPPRRQFMFSSAQGSVFA